MRRGRPTSEIARMLEPARSREHAGRDDERRSGVEAGLEPEAATFTTIGSSRAISDSSCDRSTWIVEALRILAEARRSSGRPAAAVERLDDAARRRRRTPRARRGWLRGGRAGSRSPESRRPTRYTESDGVERPDRGEHASASPQLLVGVAARAPSGRSRSARPATSTATAPTASHRRRVLIARRRRSRSSVAVAADGDARSASATTYSRPRRPISSRSSSPSCAARIAAASSSGRPGGTTMPQPALLTSCAVSLSSSAATITGRPTARIP